MSRYGVPCETFVNGEAVVGWDARRHTYFYHCLDLDRRFGPDEVEAPEFSVSTQAGEIPTVVELLSKILPFAIISDDTVAALLEDPRREASGLALRQGVQDR